MDCNLLSIFRTKAAVHRVTAQSLAVLISLLRAIAVFNLDFIGLDCEVRCYVGAGYFAAIGAVAQMSASFSEELGVFDCYGYATAETGAGHAILELGGVMGFGVAGWFLRHCGGEEVDNFSTLMDIDMEDLIFPRAE
jgi:hypothetical protein